MKESNDKLEKLLALILLNQMKNAPAKEKVMQLSIAGFTNIEIADILQTTSIVVSKLLYENKRRSSSKTSQN